MTNNAKNELQEMLQKSKLPLPLYEVVRAGPAHAPTMVATVTVMGQKYRGPEAPSRIDAERGAAAVALTNIKVLRGPAKVALQACESCEVTEADRDSARQDLEVAEGTIVLLRAALSESLGMLEGALEALAKARNSLQHALNGNIDTDAVYELDQTTFDQANIGAFNRFSEAQLLALGAFAASLCGQTLRQYIQQLEKEALGPFTKVQILDKVFRGELDHVVAKKELLRRIGLRCARTGDWSAVDAASAAFAATHNQQMHALNGNIDAVQALDQLLKERGFQKPMYSFSHNAQTSSVRVTSFLGTANGFGSNDTAAAQMAAQRLLDSLPVEKDWEAQLAERERLAGHKAPRYTLVQRGGAYQASVAVQTFYGTGPEKLTPAAARAAAAELALAHPLPEANLGPLERIVEDAVLMIELLSQCDGYQAFLQARHNRLMHASNGNPPRKQHKVPGTGKNSQRKQEAARKRTAEEEARAKVRKERRSLARQEKAKVINAEKRNSAPRMEKGMTGAEKALVPRGGPAISISRNFVETVALPGRKPVERYGGPGTGEPTAASTFQGTYRPTFTGTSSEVSYLDANSTFAVLRRDPLNPLIYLAQSEGATYTAMVKNYSESGTDTKPRDNAIFILRHIGAGLPITLFTSPDEGAPSTSTMPTRVGPDGLEYFWVDDNGGRADFVFTPAAPGSDTGGYVNPASVTAVDFTAEVYQLENGSPRMYFSQVFTSAPGSPAAVVVNCEQGQPPDATHTLLPGYYAIKLQAARLTMSGGPPPPTDEIEAYGGTVHLTITVPVGPVAAHPPAPNLMKNLNIFGGMRVLGVAALFKNVAAQMAQAGTFVAYQVAANKDWKDFTNYAALTNKQGRALEAAKNGIYSWVKSSGPEDFDMKFQWQATEDGLSFSRAEAQAVPASSYVVIVGVVPPQASAPDAQVFDLIMNMAAEYQTDEQFLPKMIPRGLEADYASAADVLKRLPQYTENPAHVPQILSDTMDMLAKGVKTGMKFAKGVSDFVDIFA